jgi:hypothetical protein
MALGSRFGEQVCRIASFGATALENSFGEQLWGTTLGSSFGELVWRAAVDSFPEQL